MVVGFFLDLFDLLTTKSFDKRYENNSIFFYAKICEFFLEEIKDYYLKYSMSMFKANLIDNVFAINPP